MAVTTFKEMCQELVRQTSVGGDGPSTVISQTGEYLRVVNWIKRACREIEGKWVDWNFLWGTTTLNTIASTQDYTLPATVNKLDVDSLYITVAGSDIELDYLPFEEYDPLLDYGANRDPYEFTILPDGQLRLLPTPDDAYVITYNYWKPPTLLDDTNDDDTPLIPARYRDIIVARAMMYYANYESADEVKQEATETYGELLAQLENDQLRHKYGRWSTTDDIQIRVVR